MLPSNDASISREVWRHLAGNVHFGEAAVATPDETQMRDVFRFAAPLGILGRLAEIAVLRSYMRALLRERNAVIREIAGSSLWRGYIS